MGRRITAATRVAAVIGDPVRHSLSPAIHNAAFEATGIDGVYVAFPLAEGSAAEAVAAMRSFDWLGLSVTMPHKAAIIDACDEISATADRLQSVNCVSWRDGKIVGDSTDGAGFVRGLAADLDVSVDGLHCAIVGAGGAAAAVAYSLAANGASRVSVINRTPQRAQRVAEVAGAVGMVARPADLATADLVINATPKGMASTEMAGEVPFDVDVLREDAVVSDLIYHPAQTRVVAEARSRGLRAQNGLPMLVYQAAAAFEIWTGESAPIEAMRSAAAAALDR